MFSSPNAESSTDAASTSIDISAKSQLTTPQDLFDPDSELQQIFLENYWEKEVLTNPLYGSWSPSQLDLLHSMLFDTSSPLYYVNPLISDLSYQNKTTAEFYCDPAKEECVNLTCDHPKEWIAETMAIVNANPFGNVADFDEKMDIDLSDVNSDLDNIDDVGLEEGARKRVPVEPAYDNHDPVAWTEIMRACGIEFDDDHSCSFGSHKLSMGMPRSDHSTLDSPTEQWDDDGDSGYSSEVQDDDEDSDDCLEARSRSVRHSIPGIAAETESS